MRLIRAFFHPIDVWLPRDLPRPGSCRNNIIKKCSQAALIGILVSTFTVTSRADSTPQSNKLDIPVPLNEDVLGIRIPYYNQSGKLEMQFDAHIARKIDENHVTLKNLTISLFEENGGNMHIEMPLSIFDLQTNILSGHNGATIKRQDLYITAESLTFQTKERFARLEGKVKMIIFNFDLTEKDSKDSTK